MNDGKSMGNPNTQGPGGGGQDYNGNPLGGGMGVQYQSGGPGPQMGFGFNPTNDMPFTGQTPVGIQGNQPAPNTLPAPGINPMPGLADPNAGMRIGGMGGGKSTPVQRYDTGPIGLFQPGQMNPNTQMGFGPAPIEQTPMQTATTILGNEAANVIGSQTGITPGGPGLYGSILGNFGNNLGNAFASRQQPAPVSQPANRFIPPNAPGVRPGIPVQSARTVQPNRYTRNRFR